MSRFPGSDNQLPGVLETHFVQKHERHGLHGVIAAVYVVTQEKVVVPEQESAQPEWAKK